MGYNDSSGPYVEPKPWFWLNKQIYPTQYNPSEVLGASLLAYWDAENEASLTLDSNKVTAWADLIGGYEVAQGTTDSQPIYSRTSFNGRPGIAFDGTNDYLELAPVPAAIPTSTTPGEIWHVVDQLRAVGEGGNGWPMGVGQGTSLAVRGEAHLTGNILRVITGDGSVAVNIDVAGFAGPCVIRVRREAALTSVSLISRTGTTTSSSAVNVDTNAVRIRIGCNTSDTPASFFRGIHSFHAITELLTDEQAYGLTVFGLSRSGL